MISINPLNLNKMGSAKHFHNQRYLKIHFHLMLQIYVKYLKHTNFSGKNLPYVEKKHSSIYQINQDVSKKVPLWTANGVLRYTNAIGPGSGGYLALPGPYIRVLPVRHQSSSMPAATWRAASSPSVRATMVRANGAAAAGPLPVTMWPSTATAPLCQSTPSTVPSMPG